MTASCNLENSAAERARQCAHSEGFSLLEALVAVALTAMALLPLLSLQQSNVALAIRSESASRRSEIEANVIAVLNGINPTEKPTGTIELAPYVMTWTSRIIGPPRIGAVRPQGAGRFALTLYEVDVLVEDTRSGESQTLTVRRVGYSSVRPPIGSDGL